MVNLKRLALGRSGIRKASSLVKYEILNHILENVHEMSILAFL